VFLPDPAAAGHAIIYLLPRAGYVVWQPQGCDDSLGGAPRRVDATPG
jgi:hypothetical protein